MDRLSSPPPVDLVCTRIEDLPIPSSHETEEIIMNLLTVCGNGVRFGDLMKVLGRCKLCHHIIALSVFSVHICPRIPKAPIATAPTPISCTSVSETASSLSTHSSQASSSHSHSSLQEHGGILYEPSLLPAHGSTSASPSFQSSDIIDLTVD